MTTKHLIPLFFITLLSACATLEQDKPGTREVAEKVTLYLDVALIQRHDRGANTLERPQSEALAQAIEQRVRRRMAEKGYRLSKVITTIGAAPDADLPATDQGPDILALHRAAARVERRLPPPLLQPIDSQGVMVVVIHGSLKSPLELQREQILDTWREMAGDHEVDIIPEFLAEGHYRTVLYRHSDGRLLWNNWGEEPLRNSNELTGLIEPALGSLP